MSSNGWVTEDGDGKEMILILYVSSRLVLYNGSLMSFCLSVCHSIPRVVVVVVLLLTGLNITNKKCSW